MPAGNNPIPNHVLNRRRNDERNAAQNGDATAGSAAATAGSTAAAIRTRPEHAAELLETEKNTVASFPRYRRMVAEFMRWIKREYPDLYDRIVFQLTPEDLQDLARHYNGATHDIRYDLLDPKWIKLFISSEKKWKDKAKKIQYGFDHPRRYHDAILKCAQSSRYNLPPNYAPEMKAYLDNMKKEKAKAKTNGQIDGHS